MDTKTSIKASPDTGGSITNLYKSSSKSKKKLAGNNLINKLMNASNDIHYVSIYSNSGNDMAKLRGTSTK